MFKMVKKKNKQQQQRFCILHTQKYINLTQNTLRDKIETKSTLLGEKSSDP